MIRVNPMLFYFTFCGKVAVSVVQTSVSIKLLMTVWLNVGYLRLSTVATVRFVMIIMHADSARSPGRWRRLMLTRTTVTDVVMN